MIFGVRIFKFTNIEQEWQNVSFQGCSFEDIEHNKNYDKYTIDGKPLFKAFIEKTTGDYLSN